jgi:CDP-4-dehydro-6-deoxyglucose reductase
MGEVRSYSFANNPRRDNKIVFFIEKVLGGVLSDYWFQDAKVDDLLRLDGPYGTFCLRPDAKVSDLCLLATGTGIAPIKAILESLDADPEGHSFSSIKLFWGGRHQKDLFWRPRFENINVEFFPVLSRERLTPHHKRYVQDELLDNVAHLADTAVYACGSPSMVASAAEVLIASGLRRDRFFSDAFVSTSGAQE